MYVCYNCLVLHVTNAPFEQLPCLLVECTGVIAWNINVNNLRISNVVVSKGFDKMEEATQMISHRNLSERVLFFQRFGKKITGYFAFCF